MNDTHTCSGQECCKDEGSSKQCCGGSCSKESGACAHSPECKEGTCSCCHDADGASSCRTDKPATS